MTATPPTGGTHVNIRTKLPVLLLAGGLAFGMGACEAEGGDGTSPGVEDPGTGGDVGGTDPLAPAETETLGEG